MEAQPAGESPELKTISTEGVDLAVWEWPGAGPPLFFAHATGFHGRCWDAIARAFPGRRRLAVEFRGHGRSAKPAPPYDWRWFGRDVAAAAEQFDLRDAIGIGHSMGGHALVSSVALRPATFAALLLVDPVILPPAHYGKRHPGAAFILRRRARWTGPAEMFERFHKRPPFRHWRPEVLRDYCEFGLLPEGDGFALACPPPVEASIYTASNAPEANLYPEIPHVRQPVTILRADAQPTPGVFDPGVSPTWPDLAKLFPCGRDVLLTGRDHYIPMETPEVVAGEIEQLLGS